MSKVILYFLFLQINIFNLYAQKNENIYYPADYEEFTIDTVLDNNPLLRVLILRKTLMDQSITLTYEDDNDETETQFYRDYSSEIIVFKSDSIIFNKTLYKNDFEQIGDEEFLEIAITHNTWIQEFDKKTKTLKISHVIGVPETDWNYHFTLYIDKNGLFHSELDEIE